MNRRLALVLVCAALVGVVAAFLVYRLVLQLTSGAPGEATEQVVVARVNVPLGDTLTAEQVKLVAYPRSSVPADAIRTVETLQGRTARTTIVANEPILESKLGPPGKSGIMPLLVPEGQRAVTISLDQPTRESGFLLPSSRVDVLVSMTKPGGGGDRIAKVVLQDVLVLAAGQVVETRDNRPVTVTTVTVALTPEQTERLTLAQTEGRIVLATRNLRDTQVVATRGVTPAQLLSDGGQATARPEEAAPPKAPAKPAVRKTAAAQPLPAPKVESVSITVIRGSAVTEQRFGRVSEQPWQEQREPNK